MKMPEDFIEDADVYSVALGTDVKKVMEIGGRIMCKLMVREQMDMRNIIATAGIEPNENATEATKIEKRCLIIVDYTEQEVMEFYRIARKEVDRMVELGMDEKLL